MTRKLIALLSCVAMLLCIVPAMADDAIVVTDMMGREITMDAPATRIVALTPSDCEILCALGAEDALVGRGTYCDYPETIQDVPVVASGKDTNLEQILALEPQVILMSTMAQTEEQVAALEKAGVKVVVSDAQNIAGVYEAIRLIGALMNKDAEAEALVKEMEDTFAEYAAKSVQTEKTVYFEVSPLQWGLWAAGKGTFMDELAAICGVKNAFADVEGWQGISEEQVLERDPDFIVTTTMYFGEGPTPEEEILGRKGWDGLKAIQNGNVMNADSNEITRPGPRLMNAVEDLYNFVNGIEAEEPAA